jgi:hypothetical protein
MASCRRIAHALFGSVSLRFDPRTLAAQTIRESDALWWSQGTAEHERLRRALTPAALVVCHRRCRTDRLAEPGATQPPAVALHWRTKEIAADGRILTHEATVSPRELFELPERWLLAG